VLVAPSQELSHREIYMSDAAKDKPNLATGIPENDLPDGGMLVGQVGEEDVLLARRGAEVFAIGAACTHYGGPLGEGLVVGDTVRCPWHHACFSLRTGEALAAPALNATSCWRVERRDGRIIVHEKVSDAGWRRSAKSRPTSNRLESVVIVGGGAAGNAAAETLRREGFSGPVTMLSADSSRPYDRPNLSKDYLAGTAQAGWVPLRTSEFYAEQDIDLKIDARVTAIDAAAHTVSLADGRQISYGGLLLATGAEPLKLQVQGATLPHVHMLRSLADSNALIAHAESARRCVVVGASFIGLEVAASLRGRGLEVYVVAPEARPMERVMGAAIGDTIRAIHESHGVTFHLGATVSAIESDSVTLSTGERLDADLVVVGIGVRPELTLATQAGLAIERGVTVDQYLQTSMPGIYAAGDIARWPDSRTGQQIRVEHWVVAERQGQVAAQNMLGCKQAFDAVPFFWSQHYDTVISYVGHAEQWDRIGVDGDPAAHDAAVTFWHRDKRLAVATIGRDLDSLRAELAFENEPAA